MSDARPDRRPAPEVRVAHCVGFYFPHSVGGTEVYVRDLATALSPHSVKSSVVAATDGVFERYEWEGTAVCRYPSNWADMRASSSGSVRGWSKFQELVHEANPDVFHLHSWTAGAGLRHLAQAAELGIPCLTTVHVPSAFCLRGTMLLNGKEPCDGLIEAKRCGQCWAMSHGLPEPIAFGLSRLPSLRVNRSWLPNAARRAATMLSVGSIVEDQARDLKTMASLCERVIAPSQWVYDALAANGVPNGKLVVSRQAVAQSFVEQARRRQPKKPDGKLCIGFAGRLESYKGAHILVEAMARIPAHVPLRLVVAGRSLDMPYLRRLQTAGQGDDRITFLGPISHDRLPWFLEQIDVLAVPSNYMETGPLVVLEAQAFGVPVMGANLGGIAERVRDGIDGWLLPFDDSAAWAAAMEEAALNREKLARLVASPRPGRTMAAVATDMASLYGEVLETGA